MLEKSTKKSAPKYARYDIWGAYLGVQNMFKWGVPEKILQNSSDTLFLGQ